MRKRHQHEIERHRPALPILLAVAGLALLCASPVAAQWDFGLRGGLYTDNNDPFLGIEALTRVGHGPWYFNPNLEAVFVDNGSLYTANVDFHYDFVPSGSVNVWAGGGPALLFRTFDRPFGRHDTETDLGFNLLAGIGFNPKAAVRPYLQGKLIFSDDSQGSVAFGVRF